MINLEWFRTFKAVYEKGSMTAAAETLFISQPGVSLHLSSLENHVGYKLFDRLPRKLIATEKAKLLYNYIIDPLNKLEETETKFQKSTEHDTPTLSVGMCFETFQISLEKYIPDLPFNLILEFDDYTELLEKLEKGVIDLVVTPRKLDKKTLTYRPFSRENIIIAAGRKTNTEGFRELASRGSNEEILTWLKSQKWYGVAGDNEHLIRFWQKNFSSHPDFRPNYIVPNMLSIIRSLSMGSGLAVIPDFLCLPQIADGTIQKLWEGNSPLSNTLYFARRNKELFPRQREEVESILEMEMPKQL